MYGDFQPFPIWRFGEPASNWKRQPFTNGWAPWGFQDVPGIFCGCSHQFLQRWAVEFPIDVIEILHDQVTFLGSWSAPFLEHVSSHKLDHPDGKPSVFFRDILHKLIVSDVLFVCRVLRTFHYFGAPPQQPFWGRSEGASAFLPRGDHWTWTFSVARASHAMWTSYGGESISFLRVECWWIHMLGAFGNQPPGRFVAKVEIQWSSRTDIVYL